MDHPMRAGARALLYGSTLISAGAGAAAAAPAPFVAHDLLYVESNNPVSGQNAVIAYHRNKNGSLTQLAGSPFATGGTGFFNPTYPIGPFDGQGIMAADPVGNTLFVPNGGSDSIAVLRIRPDGALSPIADSPFSTGGNTPEALGLRGSTLLIANNATDPAQSGSGVGPSYQSVKLTQGDKIVLGSLTTVALPAGTLPTQVLPAGGSALLYTNDFSPGTLTSYFLDWRAQFHLVDRQAPPQQDGEASAPIPLGQAINPAAPYLYVGLPNVARVGVYRIDDTGNLTFVRSVADSGAAPCWSHVSADGRRLYESNTGDSSISVYDLSDPAAPVERQHLAMRDAAGGTFDFSLSPDGAFLYVIEEESSAQAKGLSNQIHVLRVDHATGALAEIADSPVKLPVAAGTRAQGVIVF